MTSSATAAIDRRSRPFGPGFTYVNGIHASRAPRRDVQYLRLYNSGDYDHIPASIRPYYILSLMKDGHSRSSLKRNRGDSDEEGSPSATSEKSIEEAEEVEEAPVRKRRRTSSMLSEVSALEEPEQVADSDQVCSVTSLGSTAAAFNTDADDTAFESPRSHIDRPSFLGDVGDIADSRPQLEPVEEESEGEEEEEHGSRSSAASPSVVSVGSDTSQLSTPIRSSESEGTHTEGSVGIGEAVEALDEHFEEASTRSTDEEESIEEVVEPTSEEDEEEEALRRDEGDWEELESTEEAIVPSSDEGENLPFEDEEMEDVEMEDVELGSHDSDSEALEVESKASDGSGEDATPHEEEHTPESAVESPRSQIKSDEEVDGTKTPTADSLLEYHLVEESDAIGSPSESVQFSPDEDGEQPESPLGSRPIDPRESLSVDLDDLHEESDGERGSHVDKQERELAEEEEPITSATPAERATQRDDAQSEHEAEESREVQDTAVADGGETEDIPKSAAGRPLRRAAIAALDMIHSEISAFTRPYHYHTHDVPSHTEGSKEQSPKAESSPARTSPRRRSPKKERPTEEPAQEEVSVSSDEVSSAASSVESPEKMIDAGSAFAASPLGTAVGKRRSPPKDSQRSYVPSEGSSDTSSVVEDLPSTPTSSLEPIPMTPAPKRANKRGGRLTQLSRSPTIRRTTRASALEAKNRIHELAGGRGTTAHNADESQEEHLASGSALLNAIEEDRVRGMYEKSISPQGTASMKSRDLHVPPSIDPPVFHQVDNEANESVLEGVAEVEDSQPVRQSARLQAKAQNGSSAASSSNPSPEKPRRGRSSASRSAPSEATTPTKSRKRPASAAAKSKTKAKKGQLAAIPEEDSVEEEDQTKRLRRGGRSKAGAR